MTFPPPNKVTPSRSVRGTFPKLSRRARSVALKWAYESPIPEGCYFWEWFAAEVAPALANPQEADGELFYVFIGNCMSGASWGAFLDGWNGLTSSVKFDPNYPVYLNAWQAGWLARDIARMQGWKVPRKQAGA